MCCVYVIVQYSSEEISYFSFSKQLFANLSPRELDCFVPSDKVVIQWVKINRVSSPVAIGSRSCSTSTTCRALLRRASILRCCLHGPYFEVHPIASLHYKDVIVGELFVDIKQTSLNLLLFTVVNVSPLCTQTVFLKTCCFERLDEISPPIILKYHFERVASGRHAKNRSCFDWVRANPRQVCIAPCVRPRFETLQRRCADGGSQNWNNVTA